MLAQVIYHIVQEHPGRDYRLEKAVRQVWFHTDSAANELVHGRLDQAVKLTLDKNGLPYVIHPLHLAKRMETEAEICTALLHDVVEAVGLLTRRPQEDHLAYIARLRKNPIARRVKLADLDHNTDFGRKESVDAADCRRLLVYRRAQVLLEETGEASDAGLFCKKFPLRPGSLDSLSAYYTEDGSVWS